MVRKINPQEIVVYAIAGVFGGMVGVVYPMSSLVTILLSLTLGYMWNTILKKIKP